MVSVRATLMVTLSLLFIGTPRLQAVRLTPSSVGTLPVGGSLHPCIAPTAGRPGSPGEFCPAGYAFYGVDDPAGEVGPVSIIPAVGACCPLPSADILSDEHTLSVDLCPENTVATGSLSTHHDGKTIELLRCTRINTARYQLAPAEPAKYWGTGAAGWLGAEEIPWTSIPVAIRSAQGWWGQNGRDIDGCIGYPWGSMLVGKSTKYCSGYSFRQLLFRGAPGDPLAGTPVKMFPDCEAAESSTGDPDPTALARCATAPSISPPAQLATTTSDLR